MTTTLPVPESRWACSDPASFVHRPEAASPPQDAPGKAECGKRLRAAARVIEARRRQLQADGRFAVLAMIQGVDAAGKDGAIRTATLGVGATHVSVHGFGPPSTEELAHDFLWRANRHLPERGTIAFFGRSAYEEVLTVRVHPEWLEAQGIDPADVGPEFWAGRFRSLREHERHLVASGTLVLKFWLVISREEQRKRLLDRLRKPKKHWKFHPTDVDRRERWDETMAAYEDMVRHTSTPWAPWHVVPGDDKPFARMTVAETLARVMESLPLRWPGLSPEAAARKSELARALRPPKR